MRPAFNSPKASWTFGWSESEGFLNDMTSVLLCCVFAVHFLCLSLRQCGALSHRKDNIDYQPPAREFGYGGPPARLQSRSLAGRDPPDRAVAVFADQERAVMRHRDADRAAPDAAVVDDETGQEILVFAARHAVEYED